MLEDRNLTENATWRKVILSTLVTSKQPNVTLSAVLHLATAHHLATYHYNDKKNIHWKPPNINFASMKF